MSDSVPRSGLASTAMTRSPRTCGERGAEADRGRGLAHPALEAEHGDPVVAAGDRGAGPGHQLAAAPDLGRLARLDPAARSPCRPAGASRSDGALRRPLQQRLAGRGCPRSACRDRRAAAAGRTAAAGPDGGARAAHAGRRARRPPAARRARGPAAGRPRPRWPVAWRPARAAAVRRAGRCRRRAAGTARTPRTAGPAARTGPSRDRRAASAGRCRNPGRHPRDAAGRRTRPRTRRTAAGPTAAPGRSRAAPPATAAGW